MKKTIIIIAMIFLAMQFIPIVQENPKSDPKLALTPPQKVEEVLQKACYNCHTNNTQWPSYAKIAPVSFMISSNVQKARKAINFSEYASLEDERKMKRLQRAIQLVKSSLMAPSSYKLMHAEAELNKQDKKLLIEYFKGLLESLRYNGAIANQNISAVSL